MLVVSSLGVNKNQTGKGMMNAIIMAHHFLGLFVVCNHHVPVVVSKEEKLLSPVTKNKPPQSNASNYSMFSLFLSPMQVTTICSLSLSLCVSK